MNEVAESKNEIIENKEQETDDLVTQKQTEGKEQSASDNDVVQLSKNELPADNDALVKITKQFNDLRSMLVKTFLKKYRISDQVKMNALDFKSLESLEASLIKYCEKEQLNYLKPQDNKQSIKLDKKNTTSDADSNAYVETWVY